MGLERICLHDGFPLIYSVARQWTVDIHELKIWLHCLYSRVVRVDCSAHIVTSIKSVPGGRFQSFHGRVWVNAAHEQEFGSHETSVETVVGLLKIFEWWVIRLSGVWPYRSKTVLETRREECIWDMVVPWHPDVSVDSRSLTRFSCCV